MKFCLLGRPDHTAHSEHKYPRFGQIRGILKYHQLIPLALLGTLLLHPNRLQACSWDWYLGYYGGGDGGDGGEPIPLPPYEVPSGSPCTTSDLGSGCSVTDCGASGSEITCTSTPTSPSGGSTGSGSPGGGDSGTSGGGEGIQGRRERLQNAGRRAQILSLRAMAMYGAALQILPLSEAAWFGNATIIPYRELNFRNEASEITAAGGTATNTIWFFRLRQNLVRCLSCIIRMDDGFFCKR